MKIKTICISVIAIAVIIMTVLFFVLPKEDFSENENRYLADMPKFTAKTVFNGSFTKDTASYLRDHFPFRSIFLPIKTEYEKNVLAKSEINNVYICKDGYYIEKYKSPKNTDRIIKILNSLDEKTNVPISLMLVPTAVTVYSDKLPSNAATTAQIDEMNKIYENTSFNDIKVDDMLISLKDTKQLYYRLDHHWTTFAAYNAYKVFCEKMDITPFSEDKFTVETVTDSFRGTIYSKVNDNNAVPDCIEIYGNNAALTVEYPDKEQTAHTLYNKEYLDKKDKYSMFLDNLHPLVIVTNNDIAENNEIAVIKDSYANCFVPFLVNHYKKVHIFDTRYYKKSVSDYINSNKIDNVLLLYNMNTIDTDNGITNIY